MENKEFVFIVTHSIDSPERAAGALQLAANMLAFDAKIDFFLMNDGVHLARKDFTKQITWQKAFAPLHELIKTITEDFECKFYVCASCVEPYGLTGVELMNNAEIKPGSYLGQLLMSKQNLTF